jgi:putative hemolysin
MLTLIVVSCGPATATPGQEEPTAAPPTATPEEPVTLANPASVYCEEQGGVIEMRTDADGGQYGMCIFPDGSECEEWAFFRGECSPGGGEPSSTPEQPPSSLTDVAYDGISFSYDDSLAAGVTPEIVPAVGPEGVGFWEVAPEHIRFSFDGYVLSETFHEPRLLVYPVAEFEAMSEQAATTIDALRQALADRTTTPERLPFLPPANAPQPLQIQFAFLDFHNGSGVRGVIWAGQGSPVNNRELFYTFQGLTSDGNFYVSAILPVSHPTLPADGSEIPGGDLNAFMANFETYISEIEQQLEAEDPTSFAPYLSILDALIESLGIDRQPPATTAPPTGGGGGADPYAGWNTYTNEIHGYTLSYRGDCSVVSADPSASVQFVGPLRDGEHWPWFFVDHYDSEIYHPPDGADILEWITDFGIHYDEVGPAISIAGLDALHLVTQQTPQAYGSDDYYFVKDGQLFHIQILHAVGRQDWGLYNLFLQSFTFP